MTEIRESIIHTSVQANQGLGMMDGSMVIPLARSEDTDGQYALFEVRDAPGGLEHFFAELSALGTQPDFSAVAAVAGAHGIEVVGPPVQG